MDFGAYVLMVVLSHLNLDSTTVERIAPGLWPIVQPLVGKGTLYVVVLFVLTGYLMSSIYGRVDSWYILCNVGIRGFSHSLSPCRSFKRTTTFMYS